MRSHTAIVKAAGSPETVAAKLNIPSVHTVRSWVVRNRIPAEHWASVAQAKWASLEELAALVPVEVAERDAA